MEKRFKYEEVEGDTPPWVKSYDPGSLGIYPGPYRLMGMACIGACTEREKRGLFMDGIWRGDNTIVQSGETNPDYILWSKRI